MAHVLIVDDEPAVRDVLAHMLRAAGHEVWEAADGAEGLRLALDVEPDVVLCDLVMPNKEGLETIRELRRAVPALPVVAMSGGSPRGGDYLAAARALGAVEALPKPIDIQTLLRVVARLTAATA